MIAVMVIVLLESTHSSTSSSLRYFANDPSERARPALASLTPRRTLAMAFNFTVSCLRRTKTHSPKIEIIRIRKTLKPSSLRARASSIEKQANTIVAVIFGHTFEVLNLLADKKLTAATRPIPINVIGALVCLMATSCTPSTTTSAAAIYSNHLETVSAVFSNLFIFNIRLYERDPRSIARCYSLKLSRRSYWRPTNV